ncbi:MAG: pantoate--beta-alanine ligase [Myxococcales bacterium]|nr:pantoate--beta-alanine ligase [Myxococcales bacterium]
MEIIRTPSELRARAFALRAGGERIGLVPTMGALHEGHLSLLRIARPLCDMLIMSIFVNPTQFGVGEDLESYPRNEESDLAQAEKCGVDIAFCPSPEAMYPSGYQTALTLPTLAAPLCGAKRPGHFDGVATVVSKLWNAALPHVAVFGEKDFQQLAILRQLSLDLDFGIEVLGGPIIREEDGLALSSRNVYLSQEERAQAPRLRQGLLAAEQRYSEGATDAVALLSAARAIIDAAPLARIEYLQLRNATSLAEVQEVTAPTLLAVAARFGGTRLIDNLVLHPCPPQA